VRLEDLSVVLRERNPWEASDLGIALVRRHARVIYLSWAVLMVPLTLLAIALGWALDAWWLGSIVLWWLKPLLDRIPLTVISRATFGATPTLSETLRAQWPVEWRALLPWLTWRRFSPNRALLLPVDLLEGVRGPRRRERAQVIRGAQAAPAMVTILGILLESMMYLSIIALALMFVPVEFFSDALKETWELMMEDAPGWAEALSIGIYALAISAIEPFYVGAGFGQYLSRRTLLEAWDIELSFRRLAARLGVMLVVIVGLSAQAPTAHAEEPKEPPPKVLSEQFDDAWRVPDAAWKKQVETVKADPLLFPKDQRLRLKSRFGWEWPTDDDADRDPLLKWLGDAVGTLSRAAVWVIGVVLLCVLVLWLWRHRERFGWERRLLDVGDGSLPDDSAPLPEDWIVQLKHALDRGDERAALALLYRGARDALERASGRQLMRGATESVVRRFARRHAPTGWAEALDEVILQWLTVAFAHRPVGRAAIEQSLARWRSLTEAAAPP
jgi:hypothetical protein